MRSLGIAFAAAIGVGFAPSATAQSRIKTMPGYEQWARITPQINNAIRTGAITAEWSADSQSFEFTQDGKRWRFDLANMARVEVESKAAADSPTTANHPQSSPATPAGLLLARGRGKEADTISPDGKLRAVSRDQNIWIISTDTGEEKQITTDGSLSARIRNGVGSYVYLEEFNVSQPVWWSPDGQRLAWMRYDETKVDDYFLQLDQTKTFSTMLTEAYPHPGRNNPIADLLVYDLSTGETKTMNVREGAAFTNDVVGHYVWAAKWTKDGSDILIQRADRLQKIFDLAACSPVTAKCTTVVRERRPQSWAAGAAPRFLDDGKRFVWISERTNFRNLYLYDLTGKQIARLTRNKFDAVDVIKVDDRAGWVWYTARSGANHMMVQLHRVKLDGTGDKRLTDPQLTHRVVVSPDGKYFVDVAQAHDRAPVASLRDLNGKLVTEIAASDVSRLDMIGIRPPELFTFTSANGKTRLNGMLQFPSGFDPSKRYPVLVSVYGGPASNGLNENFVTPNPLAEYGFLILKVDARTNTGMGREAMDETYKQLGVAEIDDIAEGIKALRNRPYVDPGRVGIYGTSYGGSASALMLLRHPDVVQAAAASSPVTDFRLYDTAYSERHLGLPETDADAYDRSAALTYVDQLKGDLLIYYGTSDDNVHPKNALQLIKALQAAGKSFDVQVGPDKGHTGVDPTRMMEFFIQHLVIEKPLSVIPPNDPAAGPNPGPG
jgi:dipeptidyl-peptidase-4